uniref:BPTI/Kunitz inhibitor domain-containing protein n=1 Tax=Trichuris muris TaxID=70415 RepID=A0A5S6QS91_TRIMR
MISLRDRPSCGCCTPLLSMACPPLLFLSAVALLATTLGKKGNVELANSAWDRPAEGKSCVSPGSLNYAIDDYPTKFLYCNPATKQFIVASCPTLQGRPLLFDERNQECTPKFSSVRRSPGGPKSSKFGEPCSQNTDCMHNMFCPAGICLCSPGYIDIGEHCFPVINPGQSNCGHNRQCAAVWPGSYCDEGKCMCPRDQHPAVTKDGVVCHRAGFCPLPEEVQNNPSALPNGKCEGSADQHCGGMPDLYDCIPTAETTGYMCCPNRAMTCIQSKTQAHSSFNSQSRYWYNSVTGNCEQFLFDPTSRVATANSFLNLEQCQSYCSSTCRRGSPQYLNNNPKECQSTVQCEGSLGRYQCTPVGSKRLCCPSIPSFICSPMGGRTGYQLSPDSGTGELVEARWYFDSAAKECRPFQYKGFGGNFNNFLTREDCVAFCVQNVCDQGEALKDVNGNVQQCSGGRGCPSSYDCRRNVCCPSKQTVCSQSKLVGTCTSAVTRFWYNAATRDCESFVYTGCNGNDNNFDNYITCVTFCRDFVRKPSCPQGEADKDSGGKYYTCSISGGYNQCRPNFECLFDGSIYGCCPKKAYTCSLNRAAGTACGAPTSRWYFDPTDKICKTFTYLGCDGNSNNFDTNERCERYCDVGGCPYGGKPHPDARQRVCDINGICPVGYECVMVAISNAPVRYCCPTRASLCSQPPNRGTQCGSPTERYYFNPLLKRCTRFTYYGCSGNENNFLSAAACMNFCSSSACEAGEGIVVDPVTQAAMKCNPSAPNPCPTGYTCRSDSLTGANICCGSSDMGVCPSDEKAYVDPLTQQVRECQPGAVVSCPANFLCRPNPIRNRYFCCRVSQSAMCPPGKAPFYDVMTGQPRNCIIGPFNSCPPDYSCQSTSNQREGYCCTVYPLCPNNEEFYTDPATRAPKGCSLLSNGFQTVSSWLYLQDRPSWADDRLLLWRWTWRLPFWTAIHGWDGGAATDGCPPGTIAHMVQGIPQTCQPGSQTCPAGFTCQYSSVHGRYQCCGLGPVQPGGGCPPGTTALLVQGIPQECQPGVISTCPSGYSCQYNSERGGYQCCGLSTVGPSGVCPTNLLPYIDPSTGQAMQCGPGTVCPAGYSCMLSSSMISYCCGSGGAPVVHRCPFPGHQPYYPPGSSYPQSCQPNMPNQCPRNYYCHNAGAGFICCGTSRPGPGPGMMARCPYPSQRPYIRPGTSTPQRCQPVNPRSCPMNYDCLNGGDGFICCESQRKGAQVCPAGARPYVSPQTNAPLRCTGNRCPAGYRCIYSASGRGYFCCSSDSLGGVDGCPHGRPYYYPNTNKPLKCQPGLTACPRGYSCVFSQSNQIYQCCSVGSATSMGRTRP